MPEPRFLSLQDHCFFRLLFSSIKPGLSKHPNSSPLPTRSTFILQSTPTPCAVPLNNFLHIVYHLKQSGVHDLITVLLLFLNNNLTVMHDQPRCLFILFHLKQSWVYSYDMSQWQLSYWVFNFQASVSLVYLSSVSLYLPQNHKQSQSWIVSHHH